MNEINIVLNIDHNFVRHCTVTVISVINSYKGFKPLHFFIINNDLTDADKEDFYNSIGDHTFVTIEFMHITLENLLVMPLGGNTINNDISISSYFRLMVSDLLPANIKKVIYLDADVYVRHSIDELWETNVENVAIAGVPEPDQDCKRSRLGIPADFMYINAGVTVMNLDIMRKLKYPQKAVEYAQTHRNSILYHDQDIQNALLYAHTTYISRKWNMVDSYFYKIPSAKFMEDKHDIVQWQRDPAIIHFAGYLKPWHKECRHPYRHLYWNILKETKSSKDKPVFKEKSLLKEIKLIIKLLLHGNKFIKCEECI